MKRIIEVLRTEKSSRKSYLQIFECNPDENATVATILRELNHRTELLDVKGNQAKPIMWECSCMQKKCGACAMVINGKPRLACDTKLSDLSQGNIRLEPLRKFPVIEDLVVDRSIMQENLRQMQVWYEQEVQVQERNRKDVYEAARCLQCGCCLEVCPNFVCDSSFFGTAAMIPIAGLLAELPVEQRKIIYKKYKNHIYNGCGKSLSCHNVCPVGIDVEGLLVNSNAMAIWKTKK